MMKQLENKRDFKTKIIRFLTDEDPSPLSSDEEKVLARWEKADFFMRQHMEWNAIILELTRIFAISKFTAESDIASAQEVFGRSRKINKKYIVHLHMQRIEKFITCLEDKIYNVKNEDAWHPDAKEISAMAKLYEVLTYTANSLPTEIVKKNMPPPVMIFNLAAGKGIDPPMSVEAAILAADDLITDAEVLPNDDE
jgi:hypothetical protein